MNAIERAAQLGAEHGRRDAGAWCKSDFGHWYVTTASPRARKRYDRRFPSPDESDVLDLNALAITDTEYLIALSAYGAAYREAVETTVREKCGE